MNPARTVESLPHQPISSFASLRDSSFRAIISQSNRFKGGRFLPRVGLAWDPKGDGKMVIRAGYGIYQDRSHMFYPNQMSFGPPFGDNVSAFVTNLSNLWGPYGGVPGFSPQGQNPIPALSAVAGIGSAGKNAPFPTGGGYIDFANQGFKPMYSNQWNLAIEKQIDTWLFKINYIGNSVIW